MVIATTRPSLPTSRNSPRAAKLPWCRPSTATPTCRSTKSWLTRAEGDGRAGGGVLRGEEELRGIDTKPLVGNLAAWNYFESVDNPTNQAFVADYKAYAKAHKLPNADTVVTNDPMEATYVGIHMWAQAVEKAGTTDVEKVRAAMAGQTFKAPSGFTLTMDATNHHLHKPVMIGEIEGNGQFNVVWQTEQPVRAQPWSPFIAGNDKKPDQPMKTASN